MSNNSGYYLRVKFMNLSLFEMFCPDLLDSTED